MHFTKRPCNSADRMRVRPAFAAKKDRRHFMPPISEIPKGTSYAPTASAPHEHTDLIGHARLTRVVSISPTAASILKKARRVSRLSNPERRRRAPLRDNTRRARFLVAK